MGGAHTHVSPVRVQPQMAARDREPPLDGFNRISPMISACSRHRMRQRFRRYSSRFNLLVLLGFAIIPFLPETQGKPRPDTL